MTKSRNLLLHVSFCGQSKAFLQIHLTQERENEKQKKVNKYADDLVVYVKEHVKVCKTENNAFSVEI